MWPRFQADESGLGPDRGADVQASAGEGYAETAGAGAGEMTADEHAETWLRMLSHMTTEHGRCTVFIDAYRQSPEVLDALLKLAGIRTAAELMRRIADVR